MTTRNDEVAGPVSGDQGDSIDGRSDLRTRADIHDLVVTFYREVVFDDLLAPVFTEVAEVDWSVHLPRLVDYWCRVLLGQPGYSGVLLASHEHVHAIEPLRPEHFDRWLALWTTSIDQRWAGPIADQAMAHAVRIASVIAGRLGVCPWVGPVAGRHEIDAASHVPPVRTPR